ncbi:lytic polysaccharide monooxygenase auxiliary activity family 9 protein [Planosporangium sp. 12N6]|uniref:lytic polysaccharide monooxygenase auxiliary activity family 9 protein n=1 Tax=Planosporangium spinosum TaxID=3402278 RepID=UPI003CEEC7AE
MIAHRMLAGTVLAVAAPLLFIGLAAAPAQAHGAPDNPISRAVACGPEGGSNAGSAACKAAIAVSGTQPFAQWDNLRVANVGGRDRQVIPDGKLCSGGLAAYRGLDLPRADWPATRLAAGSAFTFTYRETIPHKGTFRMYVTTDGYSPTRPLTWADLESKPFLTVTDPPLTGGAYQMRGTLPAGKAGRHLIYTIWQNSSTPDTYYSCSDVVFTGGAGAAGQPNTAPTNTAPTNTVASAGPGGGVVAGGTPAATPTAVAVSGSATATAAGGDGSTRPVALTGAGATSSAPWLIGAGAVGLVTALTGGFVLRRRRTHSAQVSRPGGGLGES